MKKSLLALAVLGAFAASAQAQSNVTVYGSIDAGVRRSETAAGNVWTMNSAGTYNSNRLGFRGTEDLGGGLNARFGVESRFNSGTGAQVGVLFNGHAYVGLGGSWGTLDLGRQYSPNFDVIGTYDPFSYKYTGIDPLAAQGGLTRLDNQIKFRGNFGPATVIVGHALGEQAGDTGGGATTSVGATFAAGPFNVGGAYTTRANTADTADQNNWTVGGAFKTGPFRVTAGYANDDRDAGFAAGAAANEIEQAWVGGSFAFTPAAELTVGYFRTEASATDARTNLLMVGGTYALSKRTNFYVEVDSSKTTNADRANGFSVGLNHLF